MMLIALFLVAVLATVTGVVPLGRTASWRDLVPWLDRGLRTAAVAAAVLFGVLAFVLSDRATLLLVALPVLVTGLATFLPLSQFGNLVAGWLAAGFLVAYVVVTAGTVGGYVVPTALTMLAAAVSITPLAPIERWLEQLRAGWRWGRTKATDERHG